jgi:hypothetical protein
MRPGVRRAGLPRPSAVLTPGQAAPQAPRLISERLNSAVFEPELELERFKHLIKPLDVGPRMILLKRAGAQRLAISPTWPG